jgi:hypothetical protein
MRVIMPAKKKDIIESFHCKEGQNLKDLLIELHLGKNMSFAEIAEYLHIPENKDTNQEEIIISKTTVSNWLDLYDIPIRDNVPSSAISSIERTTTSHDRLEDRVKDKMGKEINHDVMPKNFDPNVEGFRCQKQCPYINICKYEKAVHGKLCPISTDKRKKVTAPIKNLIRERYVENPDLLEHYNNIADLLGSTWELLNRKMTYIESEDVTQILNRPDPVTGEFKEVKVANLLNGEIQKDQGMLIRLLELLQVTPKTAGDKGEEDIFMKMTEEFVKAKKDRLEKQESIDKQKELNKNRPEIKSAKDFEKVLTELQSREGFNKPSHEEIDGAQSIEDMMS